MNNITNNKIKRIVVWGLKKKYHTHRHIHQAFFKNAKKLGYKTIWLEDEKKSASFIEAGDLIISADPVGKMVPEKHSFEEYNIPIRNDIFYCLHNFKDIFVEKVPKDRCLFLQTYTDIVHTFPGIEQWGPVTYFNRETKTLYQPWGTDLLAHEFKKPTFRKNKFIFWVGSVWNDKNNQGNIEQIAELKKVLEKNKLRFVQVRFVPDFLNTFLIRMSRIAPAIAGRYQTQVNYLPCRMFKNISYGQLGITNIKKFKDILGESFVEGNTIEEIIENGLKLTEAEYKQKVAAQQDIIRHYTYKNAIENILKALV